MNGDYFLNILIIFFLIAIFSLGKTYLAFLKLKKSEELQKKQTEFLADLAHRLKSPLSVAMLNLDVANKMLDEKEIRPAQETISSAYKAANRLNHLCSNLIAFGQIDYGLKQLAKEEFNFSQLVDEIVKDCQVLAGKRSLVTQIDKGIFLNGDQARISEMILNLLDNAVKFTDPEKGKIEIGLSVIPDQIRNLNKGKLDSRFRGNDMKKSSNVTKKKIVLSIFDNGCGIKQSDLPHLFDRYYQADGRSGSAGLGLSIVKWICDQHQAKISVQSELGRGTRFEVKFSTNLSC